MNFKASFSNGHNSINLLIEYNVRSRAFLKIDLQQSHSSFTLSLCPLPESLRTKRTFELILVFCSLFLFISPFYPVHKQKKQKWILNTGPSSLVISLRNWRKPSRRLIIPMSTPVKCSHSKQTYRRIAFRSVTHPLANWWPIELYQIESSYYYIYSLYSLVMIRSQSNKDPSVYIIGDHRHSLQGYFLYRTDWWDMFMAYMYV